MNTHKQGSHEIPKMLKSPNPFSSDLACPQDLDLQLSEALAVCDSSLPPPAQDLVQDKCEWAKEQDQWLLDALEGADQ